MAGDFGEILRHEVNNPLTGILGNTELLLARRDRLPPGAVERLQTIAELGGAVCAKPFAACPTPGTNITSTRGRRKN